jgi:hypothetical protein
MLLDGWPSTRHLFLPFIGRLAMNLVKQGNLANRNDYDIVISSESGNYLGLALL